MNALKVLIDDEDVGATEFNLNLSCRNLRPRWRGTIMAVNKPPLKHDVVCNNIVAEMRTGDNVATVKLKVVAKAQFVIGAERNYYQIDFEVVNG